MVNILLADGSVLSADGITIPSGKTLRIWAQEGDLDYGGFGQLKTSKYGIRVQEGSALEINGGIIEVAGIAAPDLDKMYDITVSNGSETTTAHHGPLGYALWALSTDAAGDPQREALQRTMMALNNYNQSAKAYFNAVQEG